MTKITRSLGVSASVALAFTASTLTAASYVGSAYEGFNYTAGALNNTFNGGTGWNSTGDSGLANTTNWGVGTSLTPAGAPVVAGSGLDYAPAAYPAEIGNSGLISGASGSTSIGRQFGQSVDTGTFYFSYLTQKTVAQLRTVNLSFFGTTERIAIGQIATNVNTRSPDGTWLAGASANTGDIVALISNSQNNAGAQTVPTAINGVYVPTSPTAFAVGNTFLIVGKIEFGFSGGVEDRFTLYVNPGDLANENALTPYLQIANDDLGALTGFRMFAGATAGGFTASAAMFDEIRFGTDYNTVTGVSVPEPSTYATLLGGVVLCAAGLRRRRRA
jgi:PEP-CTERM motif